MENVQIYSCHNYFKIAIKIESEFISTFLFIFWLGSQSRKAGFVILIGKQYSCVFCVLLYIYIYMSLQNDANFVNFKYFLPKYVLENNKRKE